MNFKIPPKITAKILARQLLYVTRMKVTRFMAVVMGMTVMAGSAAATLQKSARASAVLTGLSEDWVLAAQGGEPDLLQVEHAALAHAQLSHDPSADWRRRSRRSAALPTLSVGVETGYLNRANVSVQDSISVNSSGVTIGPDANDYNQYATNQTMLTAKATWSLPDTIFHRQTLAVEQAIRSRFKERAQVSERVAALYFERLRLKATLMATRRNPARHPIDRVAAMAALQKMTGELDMMTGGWFGRQIRGGVS